jgi:alkyl sulfatase BDS1-like metallo-beta-lactamase superfamily hydrolase
MKVHTYKSSEAGIFSNAYLIETSGHIIAIDSTLLESTSKELREMIETVRKPLAAVLLTHGHPEHHNGVTNVIRGQSVDVIATLAVDQVKWGRTIMLRFPAFTQ